MEHRWSLRIPTTAKVIVYHHKIPVASCRANNIGLGGLFLEAGPMTYPRYTVLEAEFELNSKDQGCNRFRVPSRVVYSSEKGLGLMFLRSNFLLTRTVRNMFITTPHEQQEPDVNLLPKAATA